MNSVEILDKKEQLKKRCHEILDTCKQEIRRMNDEEQEEFNSNKEAIIELNIKMEQLQKRLNDAPTNNKEEKKQNKTMEKEFRLISAIRDIANNRNLDEVASAVSSAGAEEMRKSGVSFNGQIQLPVENRAAITVSGEGEDVVATDIYNVLEPLRAKNVLVAAGAKFLTGLVGDVQVPVMSASNVSWEGETDAAADGAGTFSNVKLTPKRLSAYVDVSKQFLIQDSASAEALIRQDLINAINSKLESTILGEGAGTTTEPSGIFNGIGDVTAISDFAGICNLEADIEDANVLGECKYIMSNKAKAVLRNMAKSTKSNQLVLEGGMIDGTEVLNTSNVANKDIAYGDFGNLAIGQWGGIDLTVDPYTLAKDGKIRLVINAFFDAKVLRTNAIAITKVA